MAVMTAGMHLALMARLMVEGVAFHDRQGVHVGAETDRLWAVADAQRADDPGRAEAPMHLQAEIFQLLRDDVGRAVFLEAEFRMGMDIAPPCGQVVLKGGDLVNDLHGFPALPFSVSDALPVTPMSIMPGLSASLNRWIARADGRA
jgi:hypothetical protein